MCDVFKLILASVTCSSWVIVLWYSCGESLDSGLVLISVATVVAGVIEVLLQVFC